MKKNLNPLKSQEGQKRIITKFLLVSKSVKFRTEMDGKSEYTARGAKD